MPKVDSRKLNRIIDANFNRAKEGLRVCEDVCRFLLDDPSNTRQFKNIRHQLSVVVGDSALKDLIRARNIEGDVGKHSTNLELTRRDVSDVLFANLQRVKESLRVLEEFFKLSDVKRAQDVKTLRYRIYALEKRIVCGQKK